jgi:protein involved in polysaccharide export with SLBB domain
MKKRMAALRKAVVFSVLGLVGLAGAAAAQDSSISSILQNLGQPSGSAQSAQSQIPAAQTAPAQSLTPAAAPLPTTPSRLELLYSQRSGQPLKQYGYDIFGSGQTVTATQVGGVQDNYVLGPGDQVSIVNRGHDNSAYVVTVDRDGRLIIPNVDPIMAAGRPFGIVREEIETRIAHAALGSKAYISLATARQISVVVSGEVNVPGVRTLSGLNNPVDALLLSGGVRKTGSLRNIIIEHAGTRRRFDLYAFLNGGSRTGAMALAEGDRVIVPALQDTVAVIGLVKRPGIYELPPGTTSTDAQALMRIAGGIEIAGVTRLTKIGLTANGRTELMVLGTNGVIRSGEILSVDQRQTGLGGRVALVGAVELPGARALSDAPKLSSLIHDGSDLSGDAYTLFGLVLHRDPRTKFRTATAFSLKQVFDGTGDQRLADSDIVMVFTTDQVRALAGIAASSQQNDTNTLTSQTTLTSATQGGVSNNTPAGAPPVPVAAAASGAGPVPTPQMLAAAQAAGALPAGAAAAANAAAANAPAAASPPATQPQAPSTSGTNPLLSAAMSQASPAAAAMLSQQIGPDGQPITGGLTTSTAFASGTTSTDPTVIAAQLGITSDALLNIVSGYLVWVQGEVAQPGPYLADKGTALQAMLDAAGGVGPQADLSSVEVTSTDIDPFSGAAETNRNVYNSGSLQTVALKPLDSIRIRRVFSDRDSGTVTVLGQVRFPGVFNINRGERLSQLLLRAGGITNEGYPYGAVFLRVSAAQQELLSYQREASQLESSIGVAATNPNVNPTAIGFLQTLAAELRAQKPLGLITAVLDPIVLVAKPELDILLEPGDQIFIPKRPATVAVSGEVLNAGAFQYRQNLDADDYLSKAGGASQAADTSLTFIIYPDGSAQPLRRSWMSFAGPQAIPPGSTIVVPRDPAPFNTMVFITNISDILSKLAVTAASLAVLGRN